MSELFKKIENYWSGRSTGYSQINKAELQSFKKQVWSDLLHEHLPQSKTGSLKILDIGTGPGFFATIMAERGHQVTALDCTPSMLAQARENAGNYAAAIEFVCMDAHKPDFPEATFDVIISRNLTWTLENPTMAYSNWQHVLVQGGRLLNFDANWYLHVHDAQKRTEYELDRQNTRVQNLPDHYTCTDTATMEKIAAALPLSSIQRPAWDVQVLRNAGFSKLFVDTQIGQRVWNEEEQVNYKSTPLFMIGAEK